MSSENVQELIIDSEGGLADYSDNDPDYSEGQGTSDSEEDTLGLAPNVILVVQKL